MHGRYGIIKNSGRLLASRCGVLQVIKNSIRGVLEACFRGAYFLRLQNQERLSVKGQRTVIDASVSKLV